MPDTKIEITDEMVDRSTRIYLETDDGPSASMRAALTAALALVTPGAGFRAGAEWAAGIAERLYHGSGPAIRSALAALPEGGDGPKRWRHVKRGSTYVELGRGELQISTVQTILAEGDRLIAYQCTTDGRVWFRREAEFEDGRFEPLPSPPSIQGSGTL